MNKPAGMLVDEEVVPLAARNRSLPGGRTWTRVVHRLDRGTSGCFVLALRKASERSLFK